MSSFTKSQSEAIRHVDGPLLVLAGPGSGKTTVVTKRVQYLVQDCSISPSSILVITFTKAAAMEMKERFTRLMEQQVQPPGGYGNVSFGTFHAVFFNILKLSYGFTVANIITEETRRQYLKESVDRMKLEIDDENEFLTGIAGEISLIKNERVAMEHYFSKNCSEEVFRKIYEGYEERKKRARLIDFDDMLVYTWELLSQRKDILSAWQKKYQYILVDEFQDINRLQYDILRLLAEPENNLFIVGDDDQSIYRFRGARPEIMLGFERDYPDAKKLLLDINYRCSGQIVSSASALISHNRARFPKKLRAAKAKGEAVLVVSCQDVGEQNRFLTSNILRLHREGLAYQDIAILFRTNLGERFVTDALMKANIPFTLRDSLPSIYDHWVAQDLLSYLRIASGNRNRGLWMRMINRPNRYVSRDAFPPLQDITIDSLRPYYKDKDWMQDRLDRLEYDLMMLGRMNPYPAIHYIRKAMHYEEYLADYAKERRMNLQELTDVLDAIHESCRSCRSLAEWETHIDAYNQSLKEQNASRSGSEPSDAVTLCTLHAAKGLEYAVVFLPDLNEDTIPHARASLDTDIEEERRLLYVGMTRAKEKLYLSCLRERMNHQKAPSRFLAELNLPIVNDDGSSS